MCHKTGGLVDPRDSTASSDLAVKNQQSEINSNTAVKPEGSAKAGALTWIVLGLVLVLLGGGAVFYFSKQDSGLQGEALTKLQLKAIGLAYASFGDANRRKAPSKIEDLHPYLHGNTWPPEAGKLNRECYQGINEGKYIVIWGVKDFHGAKEGSNLLIAYESEARQTSGLAIFADSRVERLSAEQLEKAISETPTQ
jgi:hypothetical protein